MVLMVDASEFKKVHKITSYSVLILHVRPEISETAEFMLSYTVKEKQSKQFVAETLSEAFKTAHPSWIIKQVMVKENL
ncbi:MAG: hypothetical protein ACFCUE_00805 [Candidatus Bathyarchaeia archaeon]|jgi:hypothetical protein